MVKLNSPYIEIAVRVTIPNDPGPDGWDQIRKHLRRAARNGLHDLTLTEGRVRWEHVTRERPLVIDHSVSIDGGRGWSS